MKTFWNLNLSKLYGCDKMCVHSKEKSFKKKVDNASASSGRRGGHEWYDVKNMGLKPPQYLFPHEKRAKASIEFSLVLSSAIVQCISISFCSPMFYQKQWPKSCSSFTWWLPINLRNALLLHISFFIFLSFLKLLSVTLCFSLILEQYLNFVNIFPSL